ncbi:hypothetical protein N9A94_04530 [Akkermansiaceae bacterium]|nr:hypothetical protein [Akkermansiaceae bacterium]MDA7888353.1 hypothetical protein [Akkermansiaceae bacterium]MDB4537367.1 hypothetical protein [Akkermansiaceae bacterium]
MLYSMPHRATPGGCLLGLLGLASLIFGGICIWGLFVAVDVPPSKSDPELIMKLAFGSAIGVSLGIFIIRWGWRLAIRSDMSDPDDQDKPLMRF